MGLEVGIDWRTRTVAVGRLRDLSLSGAYVEGVPSLPLWSEVYVEFSGIWREPVQANRAKGYVVRNEPGGFAVEWCEFAPREVLRLVAAFDESADPSWFMRSRAGKARMAAAR